MANTYVKIASVDVGSGGQASIDFTAIPSTYTDLIMKVSARTTEGDVFGAINIKVNGSTTGKVRWIQGSGAAATSGNNASTMIELLTGNGATSSTFSNFELYMPNYAGSTFKSFSDDSANETNATNAYSKLTAGIYESTTAVSSLGVVPQGGNTFLQHSTATLYGISKS